MHLRIAGALLAAGLVLAACSAGTSLPTTSKPMRAAAVIGNGIAAPVADPANLEFTALGAAQAKRFTVSVQFAGDLTAVSSDASVATVDPTVADPSVTPTGGGSKTAIFTVTPVGAGSAMITVTDKKGETARVGVKVTLAFPIDSAFVMNTDATIKQFAPGAAGMAAPVATVALPDASPYGVRGRLAFDAQGHLWAAYWAGNNVVAEFGAKDGVINPVPLRVITGPNTTLTSPTGIALDALGNIYVADMFSQEIAVFASDANGNAAPVRTITRRSEEFAPMDVAVDAHGNLYANEADFNGIDVFAPDAAGNSVPARIIGKTAMWEPFAIDATGEIIAQLRGTPNFDVFSTGTANGDAPIRTFTMTAWTRYFNQFAFDSQGELYSLGNSDEGFIVYAQDPTGTVSPIRSVELNTAGVFRSMGIAVWTGPQTWFQN